VAPSAPQQNAAPKPNIVFFLSDDHSLRDSTVYGATDVRTPNMQRLSAAGLTFNRAFVASPSCAPSRAAFLSGLMPARNGAEPNHAKPRPDIKLLPAYLHEQGYEVVAIGKVGHYNHTKDYGFDLVLHTGYHDDEAVPAALEYLKKRTSKKPLAFFVGTNWPHVPWPKTGEGYDPAKAKLPPTHIDTPQTRQWRARYYAAVTRFDKELGQVYDATRAKLGPNTLFVHSSDHGAQWPFGKWNLYDEGIHTPLIVAWSGVVKPGTRTDAMVSWVDILPTIIEAAGGNPPPGLDGRSFMPVLRGKTQKHRDHIFTTHSGDGSMNVYPMRSVRTARWKYILNLHPEYVFTTHVDRDGQADRYWASWQAAAATNPHAAAIVRRYRERPAEELYDLNADPNEQHNLAAKSELAEIKRNLRRELDAWMSAQGDKRTVFGQPRLLTDPEPVPLPRIANKALVITCTVTPRSRDGVILAQGGNQHGYALHLKDGKPIFSVRENRMLYSVAAPTVPEGKFSLEAHLEKDGALTLAVNGQIVARGQAPGPIPVQPGEELSIGKDTRVAVGDYTAPHPLQGTVENVKIATK
jgi:arylsulfatase A-like enzyme